MPNKHLVDQLPELDRQQKLDTILAVLNQHPSLAHFRSTVRTPPERQLALFAALERAVTIGTPAAVPPKLDDEADGVLCDILDVIDSHPDLKNHGSYYGPDRYLANLQALGVWRGSSPVQQPSARELFATAFSSASADPPSGLTTSDTNTSPAPQDFTSNGEVIDANCTTQPTPEGAPPLPQTDDGVLVVTIGPKHEMTVQTPNLPGILRHESQIPGEVIDGCLTDPSVIPTRPLRRGQPPKLDDLAKGRILGLMSYGLSFRQSAAQLGVHHQTILNAMKRDEQFAQQVSEARLDAASQPLLTVVKASRTNWRAAAWLAKFLNDRRASSYETTPEAKQLDRLRT